MAEDLQKIAERNVRCFTLFRMFFSARFYYPVYALLFLDYGLTLEQFGLLNGIWALTIVLSEVPSGALADTIGRRNLLIATGVLMIIEMGVLLVAPIGGGALLFGLFVVNRVVSGLAEAAASGADEALTYDALKAAGRESTWGTVMERVQRDTSLAFFFAMTIGAAVYDPHMVNALFNFLGIEYYVVQSQLVKLPILLSFVSGLVVLLAALRMREAVTHEHDTVGATLAQSWRQTLAASRWIWATPLAFGIIFAVMAMDSIIREFLTLASQYWNVIDLPIASYGLIGSAMALLGVFMPRIARILLERQTPLRNFLTTCGLILLGLVGVAFAIPFWGILPAVCLYASMHLMGFFVSNYLNQIAPSGQRATVLSFKGLTSNMAYGTVSLMYSALIASIKLSEGGRTFGDETVFRKSVFVDSLAWFPGYFVLTVVLVFVVQRLRFGKRSTAKQ